MSEPRDLRKRHSLMEAQRSSSYALFADAPEYWFSYDSYLGLFGYYASVRPTVRILNVGSATGIMEHLALSRMNNLHFVSVDNSLSFREMYLKKNEAFIKEGRAEHVLTDIQSFKTSQRFDVIVSRDFNHHLCSRDVERYIRKCVRLLAPGGVIHLKTDSMFLYQYSKAVAEANSLTVLHATEDLYGSEHRADVPSLYEVQTYYERMFLSMGLKIKYLSFRLDHSGPFVYPSFDSKYWRGVEGPRRTFDHNPSKQQ